MTEIAEGGSANVQESHKLVTVEQLYEQMGDGQIVAVKIILGLDQDRLESCGTQSCTRIKRDFPKYEASNGDFTGAYNAGSLMKPQDTQNGDQYLVGAVIGIKVYE
jgi:hypothetical protein